LLKKRNGTIGFILAAALIFSAGFYFFVPSAAEAEQVIKIFINGNEIYSDVQPIIINDRTMVPIRAISEGLGMDVEWNGEKHYVFIDNPALEVSNIDNNTIDDVVLDDSKCDIMGTSIASAESLKQMMLANNPQASEDLPELYISIGEEYGLRGDLAFCQAAKETGWWKYGGLVEPYQNNYCGLGATGNPAFGDEDLHGAEPSRVWYENGVHGAVFKTRADGVEAHIQHLYAYASKAPLPAGKKLLDPRFTLVCRGIAETWSDLDGRWAVPGNGYGQSILDDYYSQVEICSSQSTAVSQEERVEQLENENQLLRMEIKRLQEMTDTKV